MGFRLLLSPKTTDRLKKEILDKLRDPDSGHTWVKWEFTKRPIRGILRL